MTKREKFAIVWACYAQEYFTGGFEVAKEVLEEDLEDVIKEALNKENSLGPQDS